MDIPILSYIAGVSLSTLLLLYLCSWVFKFCIYHRLCLHYVLISNIINAYDLYVGIPISNLQLCNLNYILAGIFIFIALYKHQRKHESVAKKYTSRVYR